MEEATALLRTGAERAVPSRRQFLSRFIAASGIAYLSIIRGPQAWAAARSSPTHYIVRSGDTLSGIAERHRTTVSRLRLLNDLRSDVIFPGQRLRIRGGGGSAGAVATPENPSLVKVRSHIKVRNLDRSRWKHVILHHSATANGNAAIFDRYHRQRGMENGLAYHFLIGNGSDSADGQIEIGRRWTRQIQGGHVHSFAYNENSIGICLVGDFERTRPTDKQVAAAQALVGFIKRTLLNDKPRVLVHREIPGERTLCPGRHFPMTRFQQFRA